MRILAFCSTYLPAYRGGTVQAVAGLVDRLGEEHEFHVFTRDRMEGAPGPIPGVLSGRWERLGKAKVYYADPPDLAPGHVARVVRAVHPDAYYVNSFLSPTFGSLPVLLRWLRAIPHRPMVLAPRGEFHPAALRSKSVKKRAFIELARRLPAYADLLWQAGSPDEAAQIHHVFPAARVEVARDLTTLRDPPAPSRRAKRVGGLVVVYLSRVTPMKNLVGALQMLGQVRGDVRFSVYGPATEDDYLRACRRAAATMPPNVRVTFEGEVPHERVLETLASHQAFLLPTLGESFGHAILEALLAGCLLITSDQTPWRDLRAANVGWDLPLDDEKAYVGALQSCVDMGEAQFSMASAAARELGISAARSRDAEEQNRTLFRRLGAAMAP